MRMKIVFFQITAEIDFARQLKVIRGIIENRVFMNEIGGRLLWKEKMHGKLMKKHN
mgnify:CR=1 FL=1